MKTIRAFIDGIYKDIEVEEEEMPIEEVEEEVTIDDLVELVSVLTDIVLGGEE